MTWTPNRIVLISDGRHDEGRNDIDVYPGMVLRKKSVNGHLIPHNVVGGLGPLMIATEDALRGKDATQVHLAGNDGMPFRRAKRGDMYLMLLAAGQSVLEDAPLMSNGDGTLTAAPGIGGSLSLYEITAPSAGITNVVAETVFSNGSYNIPANTLQVGDVLHIRLRAVVSAQNATNTHRVQLQIGAAHAVLYDSGALALAPNQYVIADLYLTVRTIGVAGTYEGEGTSENNPAGVVVEVPISLASATLDTTIAELLRVTSIASAQSAGNVIALQEFQIDVARQGGNSALVNAAEPIDNSLNLGSSPMSGFNNGTTAFIRCLVP